jgi:Predicted dehydrogenases and related proteins
MADLKEQKKINIGLIGTGGRSVAYSDICLSGIRENVCIRAIADIDMEKMKGYSAKYFTQSNQPVLYTDYNRMLDDAIDTVIICTSDTTHKDIAIAALKKEKNILLEKPMATTVADNVAIYEESMKHNVVFRLGFVLRYTNFYRKIKELVSKGTLGQIIAVEAKEQLGYLHGASFFRRWHRFKKNNGGFLNAKCSHDMDILNWIINDEPLYVSAFGGRSYFNHKEGAAGKCVECKLRSSCRYFYKSDDYGDYNCTENICPFNSEKDIVDHEVVNIEYGKGVKASFTVSTLSAEATRTMVIFGSEATLNADFAKGVIQVKYIYPKNEETYLIDNTNSGHGGGDKELYCDFIDTIRDEAEVNRSEARDGLLSTLIALSAEISMEQRKVINIQDLLS